MLNDEIRIRNSELSEADVDVISSAIKELVLLSVVARTDGLLGLEDYGQKSEDSFLSTGIYLIVDGTSEEMVRDILEHKYYANGYTGAQGLKELIQIEGLIAVLHGEHQKAVEFLLKAMVQDTLVSMMPQNMHEEIRTAIFDEKEERRRIRMEKRAANEPYFEADYGVISQETIDAILRGTFFD